MSSFEGVRESLQYVIGAQAEVQHHMLRGVPHSVGRLRLVLKSEITSWSLAESLVVDEQFQDIKQVANRSGQLVEGMVDGLVDIFGSGSTQDKLVGLLLLQETCIVDVSKTAGAALEMAAELPKVEGMPGELTDSLWGKALNCKRFGEDAEVFTRLLLESTNDYLSYQGVRPISLPGYNGS